LTLIETEGSISYFFSEFEAFAVVAVEVVDEEEEEEAEAEARAIGMRSIPFSELRREPEEIKRQQKKRHKRGCEMEKKTKQKERKKENKKKTNQWERKFCCCSRWHCDLLCVSWRDCWHCCWLRSFDLQKCFGEGEEEPKGWKWRKKQRIWVWSWRI
jgi:hypothetical protein